LIKFVIKSYRVHFNGNFLVSPIFLLLVSKEKVRNKLHMLFMDWIFVLMLDSSMEENVIKYTKYKFATAVERFVTVLYRCADIRSS